jgi:hypothetical protein
MVENVPIRPGFGEFRRWPRFKLEVPVQIFVHGNIQPTTACGQGTALNGGGLCISAPVELAIGDRIAIEFHLPLCSDLLRMRVCVRNRRGNQYGVEFVTETDDDHKRVGQVEYVLKILASSAD